MASYVWLTSSLWQNQRAGNYRRCNWGLNGSKVGSLSALNISLMSCNYWGKFSSFGARSRKKEKECCCCCDRKSLRQKCEPSFSPINSHLCFWMKKNSEFFHVSNFRICFLVSWNFFDSKPCLKSNGVSRSLLESHLGVYIVLKKSSLWFLSRMVKIILSLIKWENHF